MGNMDEKAELKSLAQLSLNMSSKGMIYNDLQPALLVQQTSTNEKNART